MAWNGSNGAEATAPSKGKAAKAPSAGKPSAGRGALAGVLVVAAALGAWWFLNQRGGTPNAAGEEKTKPASTTITEVEPEIAPEQPDPAKVEEDREEQARRAAIAERHAKLMKMTPDERLDYLFEEAKKRPIPELSGTNRVFRTGLEQVMAWIFNCELGAQPPLLPQISMFDQAHLVDILIMDNPIKDTDSEEIKQTKENVQAAKKEFCEFIKQGGDPDEFLPYYHNQLVQAHNEFMTARKLIVDTIRNDPDIAPEFIKKVNDELVQKGIRPVTLPPQMLEKFGVQLLD